MKRAESLIWIVMFLKGVNIVAVKLFRPLELCFSSYHNCIVRLVFGSGLGARHRSVMKLCK